MSMHLEMNSGSDVVLIAFEDRVDARSLAECIDQFHRIPRVWWKHVTVELRRIDTIDPNAVDMLRYLKDRASGCSLRMVGCGAKVGRVLEDAAFPTRSRPAYPG